MWLANGVVTHAVRTLPLSDGSLRATFPSTERKAVKDSRSELATVLDGLSTVLA